MRLWTSGTWSICCSVGWTSKPVSGRESRAPSIPSATSFPVRFLNLRSRLVLLEEALANPKALFPFSSKLRVLDLQGCGMEADECLALAGWLEVKNEGSNLPCRARSLAGSTRPSQAAPAALSYRRRAISSRAWPRRAPSPSRRETNQAPDRESARGQVIVSRAGASCEWHADLHHGLEGVGRFEGAAARVDFRASGYCRE